MIIKFSTKTSKFVSGTIRRSLNLFVVVSFNANTIYLHVKNKKSNRDFPGSPVVTILPSNAGGAGLIPDQATVILHAASPKKEERKKIRKLLNLRQTRSCKRKKLQS